MQFYFGRKNTTNNLDIPNSIYKLQRESKRLEVNNKLFSWNCWTRNNNP